MTHRRKAHILQLASGGTTGFLLGIGWHIDAPSLVLFLLAIPGLSMATYAGRNQVFAELEETQP